MNKITASKLEKYLEEAYWKNNQFVYVAPIEVLSNDATHYEVYSWTPTPDNPECPYEMDKYLFDIVNLENFNYKEGRTIHTYFSKQDFAGYKECRDRELVSMASNMPLYMEEPMADGDWKWRRFLLKKFTPITKDDILTCTRYFFHEVLDSFFLFNIRLAETEKE
jgi:hypothetical protein